MGYDKAVDSAALDGALKASADAIRAKKKSTGAIAWNESNGFKSAIESIKIPLCEVGSFIPASDSTQININHNLGAVPTFAFYSAEKQYPTDNDEAYMGYAFITSNEFENLDMFYGGDLNVRIQNRNVYDANTEITYKNVRPMTQTGGTGSAFEAATDKSVILKNTYPFKAGQKYFYVLVGEPL